MLLNRQMRSSAFALGLLLLTVSPSLAARQKTLRNDAGKAQALGHPDMAARIRAGDLRRYKIGPNGVKIVGAGGSTEIQTFAPHDLHLSGDVIPAGSRVSMEPTHRGPWFKAWTPSDRRVRIDVQDLAALRRYMTDAVGEAP